MVLSQCTPEGLFLVPRVHAQVLYHRYVCRFYDFTLEDYVKEHLERISDKGHTLFVDALTKLSDTLILDPSLDFKRESISLCFYASAIVGLYELLEGKEHFPLPSLSQKTFNHFFRNLRADRNLRSLVQATALSNPEILRFNYAFLQLTHRDLSITNLGTGLLVIGYELFRLQAEQERQEYNQKLFA